MKASHSFQDNGDRLIVSHKDHGGLRLRLIKQLGRRSYRIDFFLSADEVVLFKEALNQVEKVK